MTDVATIEGLLYERSAHEARLAVAEQVGDTVTAQRSRDGIENVNRSLAAHGYGLPVPEKAAKPPARVKGENPVKRAEKRPQRVNKATETR